MRANSVGQNKLHNRREEGTWLGVMDDTGESIVGTSLGVIEARDFRRKTLSESVGTKSNSEA